MQSLTPRRMLWALFAILCLLGWSVSGQQNIPATANSIGGTVVNSTGARPEPGVWVIAETQSLPVPFRKIVVSDDQGRFLVPDLPKGDYELWVRGYGLKDSARLRGALGGQIKLMVDNASSPQEAARIYPAAYWNSLIHPPAKHQFPAAFVSQEHWLAN